MRNTEIDFFGFSSEIRPVSEVEGNVPVNEENIESKKNLVEEADIGAETLGEEIVREEPVKNSQTEVVNVGENDVPVEGNVDEYNVPVGGNVDEGDVPLKGDVG